MSARVNADAHTGLSEALLALVRDEVARQLGERETLLSSEPKQREWFGVREAADFLATTPEAIRTRAKRGVLTPTRRTPHLLFSRDELVRFARGDAV